MTDSRDDLEDVVGVVAGYDWVLGSEENSCGCRFVTFLGVAEEPEVRKGQSY